MPAPIYPDEWIADPCCRLTLDWLHKTALGGFQAPVNLKRLYSAQFKDVIISLHTYLNTNPTYIHSTRRADVLLATDRFIRATNPSPTATPYKEIMCTKHENIPNDVIEVSARCITNGAYLPHNQTRESDRGELKDLFDGTGIYVFLGPLFDIQLLQSDANLQLGEATMFDLYTVHGLADLTREARVALAHAKRLGVFRAFSGRRLRTNPTTAVNTPQAGEYGGGPNSRCCDGGNPPCVPGLSNQYCGFLVPGDPSAGCNANSDPC